MNNNTGERKIEQKMWGSTKDLGPSGYHTPRTVTLPRAQGWCPPASAGLPQWGWLWTYGWGSLGRPQVLQGPPGSCADSATGLSQVEIPHPGPRHLPRLTLLPTLITMMTPMVPHATGWPQSSWIHWLKTGSLLTSSKSVLHGPTQESREGDTRGSLSFQHLSSVMADAPPQGHGPRKQGLTAKALLDRRRPRSVGETREILITKHEFLDYKMGTLFALPQPRVHLR